MADRQTRLIIELMDRVSGPARRVADSVRGLNSRVTGLSGGTLALHDRIDAAITRNDRAVGRLTGRLFGAGAAAYAVTRALQSPVRAAQDFEEAMADVRRVVDFSEADGLQRFREDLMALSREVPLAVNDLAAIAGAAGQAGFGEDQLLQVTEAAAKIGVAFDISADRAGAAIPNIRNALGITLDETILVMDGMNHLSNNMASSASDILNFMTRVGAQAQTFGYSAEEAMAFGSAMVATGSGAEVAATSFRNMGLRLTLGEAATGRQIAAFRQLGLEATDVASAMQQDAVATTIEVIERLGQLPEDMRAAVSSDLFGNEARALAPLLTNTDLLREALSYVADESDYAGSAFEEFEVRNETFASQLTKLTNRLTELQIALGDQLMPLLSDLFDRINPIIEAISEWVQANGELAGKIALVTAGLVALNLAAISVRLVGILSVGRLLRIARGMTTLALGVMSVNGAVGMLKGLLVASGIGLALLAIGAAGTFIMNNWDGIVEMFQEFGDAFMVAIEPVRPALDPVITLFQRVFSWLRRVTGQLDDADWAEWGRAAGEAVGDVVRWFVELPGRIRDAIGDLSDAGRDMVQSMWDGFREKVEEFIEYLRSLPSRFFEAVRTNLSDAISLDGVPTANPMRSSPGASMQTDERAAGGPLSINRPTLVGEEGPELIYPRRPGHVVPNGALGGTSIHFAPSFSFSNVTAADAAQIEERVRRTLDQHVREAFAGVYADAGLRMG